MTSRFDYQIVSDVSQLPDVSNASDVYMDVETVSGDPTRGGFKPYAGDRVCGYAFTYDNAPRAFYLPVRHLPSNALFSSPTHNLPIDGVRRFLNDLLGKGKRWINHNIKFDAHFTFVEGVDIKAQLIDTLTLAKLVDMQSKLSGYGLKPLCKDWLGIDPDEQEEVHAELKAQQTHDYGSVDAEILGKYACSDVELNRRLWHEILRRRWEGIENVWDMEIALTQALYEIEQRGVHVDTAALNDEREKAQMLISELESTVQRAGHSVNLSSPSALAKYITGKLGYPTVMETASGSTSINSEAVEQYKELAQSNGDTNALEFFELLTQYRHWSQFLSLYADGWQEHIHEGVMRPSYNQTVATGRMSCGSPNMQQLSPDAKKFIIPAEGNSFIRHDYSQVEYRVIATICSDERIIEAYNKDRDTDFHAFVGDMCSVTRKSAKAINFGIAFGMGENKLTRQLAKELGTQEAAGKAGQILERYNNEFPSIRYTAQQAHNICKRRGYIKTLYGRRRQLPSGKSHKAFNTAVQGTAADIMKERVIALNSDRRLLDKGLTVRAIVHDEVLMEGPTEVVSDPATSKLIDEIMCDVQRVNLPLPLLTDGGSSDISWAEAL